MVGLYLDPPERAVVLCVDEKSQVQANADFRAGRSTLHGGGRWLAHIDAGSDNAAAVALPGFGPRANTPHWTGLR
ncbi:MAG TPA: hypothetical protein VEO01_01540 [Pseudonocardiaceae bacterium]|nr:hypothetical protein [Pseudonocardiaceae bacterium]